MKLADLKPCQACGEPIGIAFFRMRIEQHVVDLRAAQRHLGLAAQLGSEKLAFVMGTDSDESTKVARQADLLLCTECACSSAPVSLFDRASERAAAVETPR